MVLVQDQGVAIIIGITSGSMRYEGGDADRLCAALAPWCHIPEDIKKAELTRRAEWAAARLLAKKLLDGVSPDTAVRLHPKHGFPVVIVDKTESSSYFLSWAHSRGMIAAVLSSKPVGVDLEPVARDASRLLTRISSAQERKRLGDFVSVEGENVPSPIALWCAKEAAAKATGNGMHAGLAGYQLLSEDRPVWTLSIATPGPRTLRDPGVRFFRLGEFVGAVCTERALLLGDLTFN